ASALEPRQHRLADARVGFVDVVAAVLDNQTRAIGEARNRGGGFGRVGAPIERARDEERRDIRLEGGAKVRAQIDLRADTRNMWHGEVERIAKKARLELLVEARHARRRYAGRKIHGFRHAGEGRWIIEELTVENL